MSITKGAIQRIKNGETGFNPIFQVLSIKCIQSPGTAGPRYRFILTDGVDRVNAMLATQLNHLIGEKSIEENTLIQIENFLYNDTASQQIIILLELTVVGQAAVAAVTSTVPQQAQQSFPPPSQGQQLSYQQNVSPQFYQQQHNVTDIYSNPQPSTNKQPQLYPQTASSPHGYGAQSYGGAGNSRPVVKEYGNVSSTAFMPISALNPYINRWTIKARVTHKSEMRRWSNAKGEGTLFSIDLLDAEGGEIRGTFFKEACDKFYGMIQEKDVYTFSGGKLKVANKQYTTIKNNYEITFDNATEIHPVAGDSEIKGMSYHFVKISELPNRDPNTVVDVLGVVKSYGEVSEITSQKMGGKVLQKRDLTIVDSSGCDVRLTLWGEKALHDYPWHEQPIIALKSVKVGDYGGRTLGSMQSTSIEVNPDIPEGHELYRWKINSDGLQSNSLSASGGGSGAMDVDSLDKRKSIASIKDDGASFANTDKADFSFIKGSVNYIKHEPDPWYTACPSGDCNKKVTETFNSQWRCEKCDREFENCRRRYILSLTLVDTSGQSWFSAFNDTAEKLLQRSADTVHESKMNGEPVDDVYSSVLFKTVICKVKSKMEMVNDEPRLKSTIISISDVDHVHESKLLLDAIAKYNI